MACRLSCLVATVFVISMIYTTNMTGKYGVLKEKDFLDKSSINRLKFSEKITENNLSKKSFVQNLLQSVRSKMYQNRK